MGVTLGVRNNQTALSRPSVATFFELEPLYRMGRAPTCLVDPAYSDTADFTIGDHIEQMARASYAAP